MNLIDMLLYVCSRNASEFACRGLQVLWIDGNVVSSWFACDCCLVLSCDSRFVNWDGYGCLTTGCEGCLSQWHVCCECMCVVGACKL